METTQEYQKSLTFDDVWASLMELKKSQEETDRITKENARQMGYLNNRFGELAEHLVAPSIMEKFNELGFFFSQRALDVMIKEPGNPNTSTDIDILLENGDVVIAVEVKAKPKDDDVKDHVKRMEVLRRRADERNDKRKYQGAIAGAIMSPSVHRLIVKNGFYPIEQTGDTVKISMPEKFTAREW